MVGACQSLQYPLLTASFEERVAKTLKEWHVPGISIAVVHNDEGFAEVSSMPCNTPGALNVARLRHRHLPVGKSDPIHSIRHRQHDKSICRHRLGPIHRTRGQPEEGSPGQCLL